MQPEQEKQSFYSPRTDDKYKLLQRPIGVDVDTSRFTTRTIEASSGITRTKLDTAGTLEHLAGKKIDFDFTVSPGMLIDWNKSCLECDMYFAAANSTLALPVATSSLIMWNQLLTMFSEIHLQLNGVNVFDKVGDDYVTCQTLKWLVEYSREELEASPAVFGPIFDEYYSTNVATPSVALQDTVAVTATAASLSIVTGATMSYRRNQNWLPSLVTDRVKKSPTLKDLFFSIPGYSKNLKNVKISFTLKSSCPLARHSVLATTGICNLYPYDFRIQLQEVQPSPNSSILSLQDKLSASDEHLAFIDVESRLVSYNDSMVVNNQQNVQYIAVAQFGGDFENTYGTVTASLDNKGQLQLLNGYSSAECAAGTVLYRSDKMSTTACLSPPASIQAQYGSDMYPSNAINLRRADTAENLLATAELYREFVRSVDKVSPSIREEEFNRTMPLFLVKTHPAPKLMQSADIVIRMPGFAKGSNTGTSIVRVLWGKLKSFNIAPSNVVSEAVSAF